MDVKKLIEKFFLELTQATKHSATVKQPMYHLLGLLAEVFPEESVNYAERLVDTYVRTMKMEVMIQRKFLFSCFIFQGSHGDWKIWKMKMVMEKS